MSAESILPTGLHTSSVKKDDPHNLWTVPHNLLSPQCTVFSAYSKQTKNSKLEKSAFKKCALFISLLNRLFFYLKQINISHKILAKHHLQTYILVIAKRTNIPKKIYTIYYCILIYAFKKYYCHHCKP